jgi:hypothetical protein
VEQGEVQESGGDIGGFQFIAKPIEPALIIKAIEARLKVVETHIG